MAEVLQKGTSPTIPVTREYVREFWGNPKKVLKGLGAPLTGGAAGAAAEELETAPAAREKKYGRDAGEIGKKWTDSFHD